jgi:uncharacterized protein YbaR (Trm112 family)
VRRRLLQWLACPLCGAQLDLHEEQIERVPVEPKDQRVLEATSPNRAVDEVEVDVVSGALTCENCGVYYPVHNGIPRMLTYPTRVAEVHAAAHRNWIARHLPAFRLPASAPPPGEAAVLRNFSKEWEEYEWTGKSYWDTTPEIVLKSMRYSLGIPRHSLTHKLVLEVGTGIGGLADALSRSEDCEIVGMDLGYAVDRVRHHFGRNPRLHVVQASIYAPPFRAETFDVVYSHGVIHHTYSTRAAFSHIAKLPRKEQGMLYVWVYSHEQESETLLRRILMRIESVARPLLSGLPTGLQTAVLLPTLPFYMVYQNVVRRRTVGTKGAARYGWNEALHAARDRLTPPFAHRHTYEQVAEWFREDGFGELEFLRDEPLPEGVPRSYPINVGIRGFRKHAA